jgi:hypothetical protein
MSQRFGLDNLSEVLFRWRMNPEGIYATRRTTQLQYGGIGLAFAREREKYDRDSYELLQKSGGDLEDFASRYRMKGLLYAVWGELLLRGLRDPAMARPHLQRALLNGEIGPRTLGYFGLSVLGLRWLSQPNR